MEQMLKKALSIVALLSSVAANAHTGSPFLLTRSDSVRAGRVNAAMEHMLHQYDRDELYGMFSITGGYGQTFRNHRIAECFFGDSLTGSGKKCSTLNFSGSCAADRGEKDWLADNFLTTRFHKESVTFNPRARRGFADFDLYLGLDEWMCGLWFRVHAPVVHVSTELRACGSEVTATGTGHERGYFTTSAITAENLNKSVLPFFRGEENKNTGVEALAASKWAACRLSKTRLADIHFDLGWNFYNCEDYHLGLSLHVAAPTGNRPTGEYLFEPIVGNGKHWEVGAGFTGHATLWRCEESESDFGLYVDANVTHLFRARQCRVFDLVGKEHSRYMLAQKLESNTADTAKLVAPSDAGLKVTKLLPVANITRQSVDVSVGVQGDLAAKFAYTTCGFTWEAGYNLWATSCEKFHTLKDCGAEALNGNYALKGDAYIYGYPSVLAPDNTAVALAATQSKATIFAGANNSCNGTEKTNPNIDNRVDTTPALSTNATPATVGTSNKPVTIKEEDINRQGTKGLSHTVFTHLNYTWEPEEQGCWGWFVGVGGEAEFGDHAKSKTCTTTTAATTSSCATACGSSSSSSSCSSSCPRCSLSQWSVWVKGGVTF